MLTDGLTSQNVLAAVNVGVPGGMRELMIADGLILGGEPLKVAAADLERIVRRWYVMSTLTGRYSSNPETTIDLDIRRIEANGLQEYADTAIENELPETFWTGVLPQEMDTSSAQSRYFIAYQAAQVYLGDKGFLSSDITVRDLLLNRGDKHHVFPRKHLQRRGLGRGRYNQIANFVMAQSEINIAIGDKAPEQYFTELAEQVQGGPTLYGGITDKEKLRKNYAAHCLPASLADGIVPEYDDFLDERRRLMGLYLKKWFEELS